MVKQILVGVCVAFFAAVYSPIVGADELRWRDFTPDEVEELTYSETYWFVLRCWDQNRIQDIEPLVDRARKETMQRENYALVASDFYAAATNIYKNSVPDTKARRLTQVRDWAEANRDSATAQMLLMELLYFDAWEARGAGYVNTVDAKDLKAFGIYITEIAAMLEDTESILSNDPSYFDMLLNVRKCMGADFSSILDAVAKSYAITPTYFPIMRSAMHAAIPRWSGSYKRPLELTEYLRETTREDFGLTWVFFVAIDADRHETRETILDDFEIPLDDIVKGMYDYNKYIAYNCNWPPNVAAQFACTAKNKEVAAAMFEEIGDERHPDVWPRHLFESYRDWALKDGPYPRTERIHKYAESGDLVGVQREIEKGADLNASRADGATAIQIAGWDDHWAIVALLLEHGANPTKGTVDHLDILARVIRAEEFELAGKLLDAGADPNVRYRRYSSPIFLASSRELDELLRRLLAIPGLDIDNASGDGATALFTMSMKGDHERARLLLEHDAYPDWRTIEGFTPIHHAIAEGDEEMVTLLLDFDANATLRDSKDWTALHHAGQEGHASIIKMLYELEDVNPNATEWQGRTPLHLSADRARAAGIRELIRHEAIIIDAQDNLGQTPLHLAVKAGRTRPIKMLVDAGADITLKDEAGHSPLDLAHASKNEKIIALFE